MLEARGFIVAAWEERRRGAPRRLLGTGRLDDGRSFALVLPAPRPALLVASPDAPRAQQRLTASHNAILDPAAWSDLAGAPLTRLALPRGSLDDAERLLAAERIEVRGSERGTAAEALVALGVTGPVALAGPARPGRRVDLVLVSPRLAPAEGVPRLRWLALDLETARGGEVVAASLAGPGAADEVHLVSPPLGVEGVRCHASEAELLAAFAASLRARDPDVITGWNVIDFDLVVLAGRCRALGLRLDLGRTAGELVLREREGGRRSAEVAGRAVLDGLRLVRASGQRHDDLSLDAVAHAVLGEGKTVALRGEAKLAELDRLRRDQPATFAAYCLRDAQLVLQILARTGLDVLTARRAALTGVPLELAWTSIPAFERIYGAALRSRRVVPPPRSEAAVDGAAGGTVLAAEAGLFENVLVFDFRSLYPSLMRTFSIDPLAHARAQARPAPDDLVAPNGARFRRDEAILPDILASYAREREAALQAGDETAAYVYKILQNSFYGVLGSSGCRYGRSELAGAITAFGQAFLREVSAWFEARGHRVLYGDTDSVFVLSGCADSDGAEALARLGAALAAELNRQLSARIERDYGVESYLILRCDKRYRRFFIPRLRGDDAPDARGRGKGYAGLLLGDDGGAEVEVRGLEAARGDVTPLARRLQRELLGRLFAGAGAEELRAHVRQTAERLRRGELDEELVYRRALRRPAKEYEVETPPVRAARLLGWSEQRGRVDYVMTRAGAEPLEARSGAPLDHEHYVERQLRPIAEAVAGALGESADGWLGEAAQLGLFGGTIGR